MSRIALGFCEHSSLYDDLSLSLLMLLYHSRVIGLGPGDAVTHSMIEQFFNGTLVEQFFDSLLIQSLAYTAEGVSDLVIRPAYIIDLKVVSSHCHHPPMLDGVQIGLRGVILQLASLEAATGIGDGMVTVVILFLGEHRSQSFYRGVCLK